MKTTLTPLIQAAKPALQRKAVLGQPAARIAAAAPKSSHKIGLFAAAAIALSTIVGCAAAPKAAKLPLYQQEIEIDARKQAFEDCSDKTAFSKKAGKCEDVSDFEDRVSCFRNISHDCLGIE